MYAIVVDFEIDPQQFDAFLPLMQANAATSISVEADCHQFDVCTDPDHPNQVLLYELYTDVAAFKAHLESAHFKSFEAAVAKMVTDKTVRSFRQVSQ